MGTTVIVLLMLIFFQFARSQIESEVQALKKICEAISCKSFGDCSWVDSRDCDVWSNYWVFCTSSGSVGLIFFFEDYCPGVLSDEIGNLTQLQWLFIEGVGIHGTIPSSISNLVLMEQISLPANSLSGTIPSEIGNLISLEKISLSKNLLTGAIPPEFGSLALLTVLSLSDNLLSGTIPEDISQLEYLEYFLIENNKINGTLPEHIGNLTNLIQFNVRNNLLSGTIPDGIWYTNALTMDLSYNSFSGTLPNIDPTLLLNLLVQGNNFHGEFPARIASNVLGYFDASFNNFNGTFPVLDYNRQLTVKLQNNSISGELPGTIPINSIDLSYNSLSGTIPMELEPLFIKFRGNNLTGNIPNFTRSLRLLDLSQNSLSGTVPDMRVYPNLTSFNVSSNFLSGPLPKLGYATLSLLTSIDISNNQFSGSVEEATAFLYFTIQTFFMQGNENLCGALPKFFSEILTSLSLCNLQGLKVRYPTNLHGNLENLCGRAGFEIPQNYDLDTCEKEFSPEVRGQGIEHPVYCGIDSRKMIYLDSVNGDGCSEDMVIYRTWIASDPIINYTQKLTVSKPKKGPEFLFFPEQSFHCGNSSPTTDPIAVDTCSNLLTNFTFTDSQNSTCTGDDYTIFRQWVVYDKCGNFATKSQQITIVQPPTFCVWDAWSSWSSCDPPCGISVNSVQQRTRQKLVEEYKTECNGLASEEISCEIPLCPETVQLITGLIIFGAVVAVGSIIIWIFWRKAYLSSFKYVTLLPEPVQNFVNFEDDHNKSGEFFQKDLKNNADLDKFFSLFEMFGGHSEFGILRVTHVFNPSLVSNFAHRFKLQETRVKNSPTIFMQQDWPTQPHKNWILAHYKKMAENFFWNSKSDIHIVPVLHAVKDEQTMIKIASTGFAKLSLLDNGYFGKGMYFTSSAEYAAKYCPGEIKYFVVSLALPGNVFPCDEEPFPVDSPDSLYGKALKSTSHYALVGAPKFFPVPMNSKNFYDELVVDQEAFILPLYLVQAIPALLIEPTHNILQKSPKFRPLPTPNMEDVSRDDMEGLSCGNDTEASRDTVEKNDIILTTHDKSKQQENVGKTRREEAKKATRPGIKLQPSDTDTIVVNY